MAIKPCRECGKDVSSEAKVCPHCGIKRPVKPVLGFVSQVLVLVVVVGALSVLFRGSGPPASPPAPPTAQDSARTMLYLAKDAAKSVLKDPESARFGSVFVYRRGTGFVACGNVNAKNSFGGYTGDTPFISRGFADATLVLSAENANNFRRAFETLCKGKVLASSQ